MNGDGFNEKMNPDNLEENGRLNNERSSSMRDFFTILTQKDEIVARAFSLNDCVKESISEEEATRTVDLKNDEKLQVTDIHDLGIVSMEHYPNRKKTLMQRYFSKVDVGSLRGCILTLISYSLGVGCQALPLQFNHLSFVMGLIMIAICGVSAFWSHRLLYNAALKLKIYDFSKLVRELVGSKYVTFLNCCIITNISGTIIANQINVYQLFGLIYYNLSKNKEYYATFENFMLNVWSSKIYKSIFMYGSTILIVIPFAFLNNIGKMRIVALSAMLGMLFIIIIVIIQAPWFVNYYIHYKQEEIWSKVNWYNVETGFTNELYFFRGTAVILWSYVCHSGVLPVLSTLKNNETVARIHKVISRTVIFQYFAFTIIAVAGFLTAPVNTPEIIVYRHNYVFDNDILIIIGQIASAVVLLAVIPLKFNTLRLSAMNIFTGSSEFSKAKNFILIIVIFLLTTTVGLLYDVISNYLSILGGFCSVVIGFLTPCLLFLKSNELPRYHWKNILTVVFLLVIGIIGMISVIRTFISIVYK